MFYFQINIHLALSIVAAIFALILFILEAVSIVHHFTNCLNDSFENQLSTLKNVMKMIAFNLT